MPDKPLCQFSVSVPNPDGLSLCSIVRTPRVFKPQDIETALANLEIAALGGNPCAAVSGLAAFVIRDFFALAHRTGLYNRQRSLWESMSRVSSVRVFQQGTGLFRRRALPVYELHFLDFKERALVLAMLLDAGAGLSDKQVLAWLRSFVRKAGKFEGLTGLFFSAPVPFPPAVCQTVAKMTGAADPVARYEARLPEPQAIHLDLLEMQESECDQASRFRLVHPDLTAARRIRVSAQASE